MESSDLSWHTEWFPLYGEQDCLWRWGSPLLRVVEGLSLAKYFRSEVTVWLVYPSVVKILPRGYQQRRLWFCFSHAHEFIAEGLYIIVVSTQIDHLSTCKSHEFVALAHMAHGVRDRHETPTWLKERLDNMMAVLQSSS